MNQNAFVVASKYRRVTPAFKDKSAKFIVELNAVDADVYTTIDLAAPPTKLSEAHRVFKD